MFGEQKQLTRFILVPLNQARRRMPLFIASDELRKSALDKGEVKEMYQDVHLSPIKPKDPAWTRRKKQPSLFVKFGPTQKPDEQAQAGKAIPGQVEFMAPLGPQDPLYTKQPGKSNIHLEAAKHYIQADFHGRHPSGFGQADEHHKQFLQLRKQGAQPTAEHFKQAMESLHPKYKEVMKSRKLFVTL